MFTPSSKPTASGAKSQKTGAKPAISSARPARQKPTPKKDPRLSLFLQEPLWRLRLMDLYRKKVGISDNFSETERGELAALEEVSMWYTSILRGGPTKIPDSWLHRSR